MLSTNTIDIGTWRMLPSVGTWLMKPSLANSGAHCIKVTEESALVKGFVDAQEEDEKAFHMASELSIRQAALDLFWDQVDAEEDEDKFSHMVSELCLRQAAFDSFWAQVDEQEEDDKFSHMVSELSLRQAAFDFFWAQADEEEEDDKFSYMISELSLRQAAFDLFWAQLDQEEEDDRVLYLASELSLRQTAFDSFWAQLDQEEEDEKVSYMIPELSLRQAAFDSFWARLDQEEDDDMASYMASELSLRQATFDFFWARLDEEVESAKVLPKKIGQYPRITVGGPVHLPKAWPTFSMAGSPAKSIRLAKVSMSKCAESPLYFLQSDWSPEAQKMRPTKKRSSSTSAMVLDLGERCADSLHADLASLRAKSSSKSKVQNWKGIDKRFVLPPLKGLTSSFESPAEHTKLKSLGRGC